MVVAGNFLGFGRGRAQRPLAVDVLAAADRGPNERGVLRTWGRDDHQIDVGMGDEVVVVAERVGDVQICRKLVGGLLPPARDRDNRELVERAEGGNMAVLRPAAGSDDADPNGVLGHGSPRSSDGQDRTAGSSSMLCGAVLVESVGPDPNVVPAPGDLERRLGVAPTGEQSGFEIELDGPGLARF